MRCCCPGVADLGNWSTVVTIGRRTAALSNVRFREPRQALGTGRWAHAGHHGNGFDWPKNYGSTPAANNSPCVELLPAPEWSKRQANRCVSHKRACFAPQRSLRDRVPKPISGGPRRSISTDVVRTTWRHRSDTARCRQVVRHTLPPSLLSANAFLRASGGVAGSLAPGATSSSSWRRSISLVQGRGRRPGVISRRFQLQRLA